MLFKMQTNGRTSSRPIGQFNVLQRSEKSKYRHNNKQNQIKFGLRHFVVLSRSISKSFSTMLSSGLQTLIIPPREELDPRVS